MTTTTRSALVAFVLGLLAACGSSSTSPPAIPAAPTAVAAVSGIGQVTVSWTASSGADSYNLYYSTSAGVSKATGTKVAGAASGAAVTGLTNGTAYYFVVTAVNAAGESAESSPAAATPHPSFDGTWVACRNDGAADYREVFTIAGASVSFHTIDYATTADASCDGDGVPGTPQAFTAVHGASVSAGLGAGNVLATQVDLVAPPPVGTFYTLSYRDTAASPDALHIGDDAPPLDGSAPALRPDTLQSLARTLQTDPVASDLTGEWRYCPPAADGSIVTIDAASGTFDATKYTGTCAAGTVREHVAGTFTFAVPVYASLEGTTVTAFAVNIAITTPVNFNTHTTFWVDTEASPRHLFGGNDELHGMDGSTPALRPRVLRSQVYLKQ